VEPAGELTVTIEIDKVDLHPLDQAAWASLSDGVQLVATDALQSWPSGGLAQQRRIHQNALDTANRWRAIAEANKYSLRELAIHVFGHVEFVGTPAQVAERLDAFVQNDGSDGFIIGSHLTPTGLDEFVDRVVPLLRERGPLRTEYDGTTLRDNLRIPAPGRNDERPSVRPVSAA
jgi:alkanesulfonate monooxygenase SsuD/methylene tetrahydromethanopterin reductase-like flavin-dependent oxidoreductase (luciferase family)